MGILIRFAYIGKLKLTNMTDHNKINGVVMKIVKYVLFLLFTILLCVNISEAKKITFLTHAIKPFSYMENNVIKGFAVDIVKEMMRVQKSPEAFEIYPFIRGLRMVQNSPNLAFFIVARTASREETVKWVGPLITSGVYFYKVKGDPIKANSLENTKNRYQIAVQRGNADHTFLRDKGFTKLTTTNNQLQSLKMLYKGRVDLTPVSELVMPEIAKQAGIDINNIERTDIKLYDSTLYIVFSKDTPDETVAQWQQVLDALKISGRYQDIYNKYLASKLVTEDDKHSPAIGK
jgi:polar amino acid transport system substrate-binding protein